MSDACQLHPPSPRATRLRKAVSVSVSTLLITAGAGFGHSARSAELESKSRASAPTSLFLDGRTFHGEALDENGVVRAKDVVTFKDGKFYSENCKQFGFNEIPYWTRMDGETIHFLAESESPASGTMVYRGTIRGAYVEGKVLWTKKRWYWSIRREIRFRGVEQKQGGGALPSGALYGE